MGDSLVISMNRELQLEAKELVKEEETTVSRLANDLDVPVRWLYFHLDNSPIFELGEKQSENPNSHEVKLNLRDFSDERKLARRSRQRKLEKELREEGYFDQNPEDSEEGGK